VEEAAAWRPEERGARSEPVEEEDDDEEGKQIRDWSNALPLSESQSL
jgi:hypothetical protein